MHTLFSREAQVHTCPEPVQESVHSLTLFDLFTALCEETEDDTLVAAAVIDLFRRGYVRFQREERIRMALS